MYARRSIIIHQSYEINHKAFYTSNLYVLRFVSIFTDRFIERSIIVNQASVTRCGVLDSSYLRSLWRRWEKGEGFERNQFYENIIISKFTTVFIFLSFLSFHFSRTAFYYILSFPFRSFISHYEKFPLHAIPSFTI